MFGILLVMLNLTTQCSEKIFYVHCNDVLGTSIQLSERLIGACKVLSQYYTEGTRKISPLKLQCSRALINHLEGFIHDKNHLDSLSIDRLEQLYHLGADLQLESRYHTLLADILWSEWQAGYSLNPKSKSLLKSYIATNYDKFLHNFVQKINYNSREFLSANIKNILVGQKYIGFWEQKNTWFSSIYPQFVAYFMPLRKIFSSQSPSLEDHIRMNAQVSIPLNITDIEPQALVFRDDQKSFTLVECKKNGALHRYENDGLQTYKCNFENVSDVCYAPLFGFFVLYKHTYDFQLLFFEFKSEERKYALREYFPYRPWDLNNSIFNTEKPCIFLGWNPHTNMVKLLGISKKDNNKITSTYQCKHAVCCPLYIGESNEFPVYNAIAERYCLHNYSYSLSPVGFYSHTPNGRLWLSNPKGKLTLYNLHENYTRELGPYNNEETYFLSNTVLLMENRAQSKMTFWDMTSFNLVKERFDLVFAQ